jgi:hypothetical protein
MRELRNLTLEPGDFALLLPDGFHEQRGQTAVIHCFGIAVLIEGDRLGHYRRNLFRDQTDVPFARALPVERDACRRRTLSSASSRCSTLLFHFLEL